MFCRALSPGFTLAVILFLSSVHRPVVGQGAVSLLFQNDGNWSSFANKPSALYFHEEVGIEDADAACESYGETLIDCNELSGLAQQFSYQKFLGNLNASSQIWTADNQVATFSNGNLTCSSDQPAESNSSFVCTNSAPFTSKVDTDFSGYPRVETVSNGTTFTGTRDHFSFRFTGVPYAKAPVGDLRFAHAEEWEGDSVNATLFRSACLQFGFFADNSMGLNPWGISEDCLYLNVFTPFLPSSNQSSSNLKPVMLWIHGGGNTGGTGSDATFDGGPLSSRSDVVLVTINYRLNIFGYLGLDNETIPGNYALSDKIMALQWVQDHITAFGGDPARVTIFGQSAGGWSIGELLTSPRAKGLFSGAIAQSGINLADTTYDAIRSQAVPVLTPLCNGTVTSDCLRSLSADVLLNVTNTVTSWSSVIDGDFRLRSSVDQAALGPDAVNSVNLMTGFMPDEGQSLLQESVSPNATDLDASLSSTLGSATAQRIIDSGLWEISGNFTVYNATQDAFGANLLTCPGENFVTAAASANSFPSTHVYQQERGYGLSYYNPYGLCSFPVGQVQPYYRCHSGDLYEVFGTYYFFDQPIRSVEDIYHTNLIQDLWGSFARTGDPNVDKDYLTARGYDSSLTALQNWSWPVFMEGDETIATLQWADMGLSSGLPETDRCKVLLNNG